MGSSCFARGNTSTVNAVQDYVKSRGLESTVEVGGTLCQQKCGEGPNIQIDGECVCGVAPATLPALLDKRLGLQ
jgi:NADH:ubiquinone oxidoreductase subunit E